MGKKWWLKPLIAIIVVVAVLFAAWQLLMGYLGSRSVVLTMDDIIATVQGLKTYLIVLGCVAVLALAVAIAATFVFKKPLRVLVRREALIALLVAIAVVVNTICLNPMYSLINNTFGDRYYLTAATQKASEALTEEIAGEGMVLLKNDGSLPIETGKLNVFGWSSTNPVYGGTGSGSVDASQAVSLLQGLKDAGFETNKTLSDFYVAYRSDRPDVGMNGQDWTVPEPSIADYEAKGIFENAKAFSDTALIVIGRSGGENADLPTSIDDTDTYKVVGGWAGTTGVRYSSQSDDIDPEKTYLELTARERAMVERVTSEFENVYIVINSANAMELGWLDEYDSIKGAIWCAGPGQTGFRALGRILNGTVNPSGRLVDTYVYDLKTIPAFNWVGSFTYDNMHDVVNANPKGWLSAHFNNYIEGIYVGYKFYETAAEEGLIDYGSTVQFPFGYGLSYTTFSQEITAVEESDDRLEFTVSVTNTGSVAGKDVVEVYFTPPYTNGGIEKASVNLVDFGKTGLLQPGESESISFLVMKEDLASYDYSGIKAEGGAYVLEEGSYTVSIRSDSHTVLDSFSFTVASDVIYSDSADGKRESDDVAAVNRFDRAAGDNVTYLSRKDGFANYSEAVKGPEDFSLSDEYIAEFYAQATYDLEAAIAADKGVKMPTTGAKNGLTIRDMEGAGYDDPRWTKLLDQLTVSEMNSLIALGGYEVAKVDSIDLPALVEVDGPAALKNNFSGQTGTAFTAATMLAATWSKDLAYQRGDMVGRQAEDMNIEGWYGPAMNIHRTPFSGRNFEYYSEDGVLSGMIGAEEVKGAKAHGLTTYIKHFALNDSENNRKTFLATWTNEQAMREVYLKPFELSVKLGGARGVMTAFNYIGANWASTMPELLKDVLRSEWGFRGVIVTDWFNGATDGIMMADSAVRAGTTKMLSSQGDPKAYMTRTDSASTVAAMREAAHDYLYAIANSNAMNDRNYTTAGWVKTLYTVDTVLAVLFVLCEAVVIISFLRKRKKGA